MAREWQRIVTMREDSDWESDLAAMAAICRAAITYTVERRLRGEVLISLAGSKWDVEKVYDVGRREGVW